MNVSYTVGNAINRSAKIEQSLSMIDCPVFAPASALRNQIVKYLYPSGETDLLRVRLAGRSPHPDVMKSVDFDRTSDNNRKVQRG